MQGVLDIAGGDAFGIERNDLLFEFIGAGLVFVEEHRLIVALAVAWHLNRHVTSRGAEVTCAFAVAGVTRVASAGSVGFISKMGGEFGFHHLFERASEQSGKNPVLAKEIVEALGGGKFLLHTLGRWKKWWWCFL